MKAWKFGDNIDTDAIIPARYLNTIDEAELAKHCMEDADKEFSSKVSKGDVIVAGENFGCGSSREHAPISIKGVGVSCVIAKSFARIFFRNSINTGLAILESRDAAEQIENGHELEIDTVTGEIRDITTGKTFSCAPYPEQMRAIIDAGGLMKYVQGNMQGVTERPRSKVKESTDTND